MHRLPPIDPSIAHRCLVVLESRRPDAENHTSYIFRDPEAVLTAHDCAGVERALREIDRLSADRWIAGYISYEAGLCMEESLGGATGPLLWLGVYSSATKFDHITGKIEGDASVFGAASQEGYSITNLSLEMDSARYAERIGRVKDYIAAGDVYQVDFTTGYGFGFEGSAYALYDTLKTKQTVPYAAFIRTDGGDEVLSLSPELFLRCSGDTLTVRPMKGTASRGRTSSEDASQAAYLSNDPKNRAENVMIVDLMRNDLGRISVTGGVRVTSLFDVERYESLLQMTSTVTAELRPDVRWSEIMRCLFPSGSVTGAPKIRAMEIIRELEEVPRGVYTGAIGFIAPGGREAAFNVPIRTIELSAGRGRMGIGSGIVADSVAAAEYDECVLKAAFLTAPAVAPFKLIETMLWERGEYQRLELHIGRLAASASYFEFPMPDIARALEDAASAFDPNKRYRVRLTLDGEGRADLQAVELVESTSETVTVSPHRTSRRDLFLYHKTTHRALYDAEFKRCSAEGHADVLFMNEEGELTEGAISNVYVEIAGRLYTPPIECGLLGGVMRRVLLQEGKCSERVITEAELKEADAVYISNSVRGLRKVRVA